MPVKIVGRLVPLAGDVPSRPVTPSDVLGALPKGCKLTNSGIGVQWRATITPRGGSPIEIAVDGKTKLLTLTCELEAPMTTALGKALAAIAGPQSLVVGDKVVASYDAIESVRMG